MLEKTFVGAPLAGRMPLLRMSWGRPYVGPCAQPPGCPGRGQAMWPPTNMRGPTVSPCLEFTVFSVYCLIWHCI